MDEVVEVENNGADKDDLIKDEGLYDVNEHLEGLTVERAALKRMGLLDEGLKKCLRGRQSELQLEKAHGSPRRLWRTILAYDGTLDGRFRRMNTLVVRIE